MRIGDIDFPQEVIRANEAGRLVIFAGAGVSKDPPSNYPDFEGLIEKIAEGTNFQREQNEPYDHFLGRLKHEGVKVHEQARELLTNPNSQPNCMHDSIVQLFRDKENLRIITTNFDLHFTTVIESANLSIEIYKAPALPIGSS